MAEMSNETVAADILRIWRECVLPPLLASLLPLSRSVSSAMPAWKGPVGGV